MATISILDFTKKSVGYGQYNVTYTSKATGKMWTSYTSDSKIIDKTFNSETQKVKDLVKLKRICKGL